MVLNQFLKGQYEYNCGSYIFGSGLVSPTTTCLCRHLTAQTTAFRWPSANLSFILYCPTGLPSPYPQDFLNYPQFGGHLHFPDLDMPNRGALCSLLQLHTIGVPNKLKPSDLLIQAITFRICFHSPQNNLHPSPACSAPSCFVSGCLKASGSVWPEL